MRYAGGKSRIAKRIAPHILRGKRETGAKAYVEPFVGGGAVGAVVGNRFREARYSDLHPDLILMWQHALAGGAFPTRIGRLDWERLKRSEPSALRGFAGFAGSFGGSWFGAYARGRKASGARRNYVAEASRRIALDVAGMQAGRTTTFSHHGYEEAVVNPGDVVYADPPYRDTVGYSVGAFDHDAFWETAHRWAQRGAYVLVSEYDAPADAEPLADWEVPITIAQANGATAVERLYRLRPARAVAEPIVARPATPANT